MTEFVPYRTEAEIEEVVRRFEACEYAPEEFFHARHLTMTAWYFLQFDERTAQERVRAGLMKFIQHHNRHGYHETITGFWLQMVCHQVRRAENEGRDLVAVVNEVVELFGDKSLIYEYYSRERIESPDAKSRFLEPDLHPIDEQW